MSRRTLLRLNLIAIILNIIALGFDVLGALANALRGNAGVMVWDLFLCAIALTALGFCFHSRRGLTND